MRETNPFRALLGYLTLRETNPSTARVFSTEQNESEQRWQEVESDSHAPSGALNFKDDKPDVQSYDARSSKHVELSLCATHTFFKHDKFINLTPISG